MHTLGAHMQVMPEQDPKPKRLGRIHRSTLNTVLLVFILVLISGGAGFGVGFQLGKREGAKLALKKVTDFLNPLSAISNGTVIPRTLLGKVSRVSEDKIAVKMANGEIKEIPMSSTTKVTQGDKTLSRKDIKSGNDVTVFTTSKDKNESATRVIIR